MADAGFFKGTSADQDRRFSDKELKLLKTMKFPPEFEKKVDMRKVNLSVIRPWVVKKIVELVGFEDEVVVEYAMGLLEDDTQPTPDPRKMQINLTGFLTNHTAEFMSAVWKLLLEAQESPAGVPQTFVEEKKAEMRQARMGDTRALEERDRRARLDEIRDNERDTRANGRGRGRGRGRGGRGGFDDDRGGRPRDSGWGGRGGGRPGRRRSISRSPPPRSPPPRRRRSPSRTPPSTRSSRSRSRTPPARRFRSPPRGRLPSRSPPRRARSPLSRSPLPRRRPRSPSYSPPPRDRDRRPRERDSRSPPTRRRRLSPPTRSRSRSPPYRAGYRRRRSPTRSLSRSRSPPPTRNRRSPSRSLDRSPPRRNLKRSRERRRSPGRSRSRTLSRSKSSTPDSRRGRGDKMDVDENKASRIDDRPGELKIKGQAAAEKRQSKWEEEDKDMPDQAELERRESELKEKALRNKVVRTRKGSANVGGG